MLLLASYFPHRMYREKSGAWSFWNRNGYPVGVNLSEGDRRWSDLQGDYPQGTVKLPKFNRVVLRKLRGPEWLTLDWELQAEEGIDLYGPTSNPCASKENMDAYLERLRILMAAGALMLFPYGMELQKDRSWVFLNRNYKPVGMNTGLWVVYEDWPVGVRLTDLDRRTLANLSCTGFYDEEWEVPGMTVHLWEDSSLPTHSARNMDAYLMKLRTLAALDGRSNSRAPWRYRLGRWARTAVAEVNPAAVASALFKALRP